MSQSFLRVFTQHHGVKLKQRIRFGNDLRLHTSVTSHPEQSYARGIYVSHKLALDGEFKEHKLLVIVADDTTKRPLPHQQGLVGQYISSATAFFGKAEVVEFGQITHKLSGWKIRARVMTDLLEDERAHRRAYDLVAAHHGYAERPGLK